MAKVSADKVERFMRLFVGNSRSYGIWNPDTGKMFTAKQAYTAANVQLHLDGEMGLGLVPIMDDDTCWFGAIDIDTHGSNARDIDLYTVEKKIRGANVPLVPCRSKSGGVHCYLFLAQATAASLVRLVLEKWAVAIGFPGCEIFPKQGTVAAVNGERPLGNWLNLAYFKAAGTDRYAAEGGKPVDFDFFLELAESRRYSITDDTGTVKTIITDDYRKGPPCLEKMLSQKLDEGSRNTAMFQAAVFLKRAFPDDWKGRMNEFNREAFENPLTAYELRTIGGSIARKDYHYKCREEPCKTLCDQGLCKTREFGISAGDQKVNEFPLIDRVEKVIATPVRWILHIKGEQIEVTTEQLYEYKKVREAVGERLHMLLPRMKSDEWDQFLREIMGRVELRQETTLEEMLFERLCDYLRKADQDKTKSESERREALRRHMPAYIGIDNTLTKFDENGVKLQGDGTKTWYFSFRMTDFTDFLRRKKLLTVPDHAIPTYLSRILGAGSKKDRLRMGGSTDLRNVWFVPEEMVERETFTQKKFDTEF